MTAIVRPEISEATVGDAAEILVLQRCCWVTEAIANDTLDIPALHEDLDCVRAWITDSVVLWARLGGRLVGAVRGSSVGNTWQIGRLMVAPDLSGRGLGRELLTRAEEQAPTGIMRFELFTGARSDRNLRMYARAGYEPAPPSPQGVDQHISGAVYLTKEVVR